ncbi:MAG: TolC family protein [Gammaproteobacteria bacterium]|nr:TolC family protein [Gammaproteobacteria bacterium]MBU1831654.1 TolC family protein [Gammaproteobacteria bacterium]
MGKRARTYAAAGLILLGVLSESAFAQSPQPLLSLERAIANTLAQNPQLHQFSLKHEALLGRRESYDLSPSLNAGVEIENLAGSGNFSSTQSAEITLALSSVIELGGKRSARVSVANSQIQSLEYQRQASTLDVLGELTAVFIRTIALQEQILLARESRDLAKNTLAIVKRRAAQGATPDSEVQRAAATFAQANLRLTAFEQGHERLAIKLAAYWGDTSPSLSAIEGDLYRFVAIPNYEDLYQRAQSSPTINMFASEKRLKRAELALAETQSIGDINWQLGVRRFEESGDTAFTAGVSIPLFAGRRNSGAIQSARAAQNEVEFAQQSALLKLHVQLFEAHSQWRQHVNAVTAYRKTILPDLTSAMNATQQAYEAGRYSYQDWISAQNELLDAKRALIENAAAAALNQAVIEQLIAEPVNNTDAIDH